MRKYQEVARTVFLTSGDQKRKLHVELQDKVTGLYTNIRLFQKGLEKLPGMLIVIDSGVTGLVRPLEILF